MRAGYIPHNILHLQRQITSLATTISEACVTGFIIYCYIP